MRTDSNRGDCISAQAPPQCAKAEEIGIAGVAASRIALRRGPGIINGSTVNS